MTEQKFRENMEELLPGLSEKAMESWMAYARELDADGVIEAQEFFDKTFVELDLIRQHQGSEIARRLFDYGEHFTLNPFELRGAASLAAQGASMESICQRAVEDGCDCTLEESEESKAALARFQAAHTDRGPQMFQLL